MVVRSLLAMLVILTGLLVAASPVAASAMSIAKLCGIPGDAAVSHVHAARDHKEHSSHLVAADENPSDDQKAPACCDHACLYDVSAVPLFSRSAILSSRAILAWSSSDLVDLTQLGGLKRPPKA